MKQIFKSIIAHPGRNAGLLIEIIIITIIGWIVIEPVAIKSTIALIPAGYDHDRLVNVSISKLSNRSESYDGESSNQDDKNEASERLMRMLRERDGVEKATLIYTQGFESGSYGMSSVEADSIYYKKDEENYVEFSLLNFKPDTDFFSTFGIKDTEGKPFTEPDNDGTGYIITETVAKALTHDGSVVGRDLYRWDVEDLDEGETRATIIGVTGNANARKGDGRTPAVFKPATEEWLEPDGITMRLREGVSARAFVDKLTADLGQYRSGNHYITHPQLYSDMRDEIFTSQRRELTQKWIIVIFFLVNMLLGIAGSFYVQCKTRIPDAGVMRAFGARRKLIEWSIIGEACILTFTGWLIGSIIYILYLKYQGFPMDFDTDSHIIRMLRPLWYDTRVCRYSIISGIILLLLLATSALGAWLPARKVGQVPIVDSLRDE